jgi:hypothetical protein
MDSSQQYLSCLHQRASLVIRFRCLKHEGGGRKEGFIKIRQFGSTSYCNQTLIEYGLMKGQRVKTTGIQPIHQSRGGNRYRTP